MPRNTAKGGAASAGSKAHSASAAQERSTSARAIWTPAMPRPGTCNCHATQGQRPAPAPGEAEVDRHRRQQQGADGTPRGGAQVQPARCGDRLEQQCQTGGADRADPEGEGDETGHQRHIGRGEPPGGVQAHAHGAGRQHGQTQVVADRRRDERRRRDARIGQRLLEMAQGQPVVAGQGQVAAGGGEQGQHEGRPCDLPEGPAHVGTMDVRELAVQHPECEREQRHADDGDPHRARSRGGRWSLG